MKLFVLTILVAAASAVTITPLSPGASPAPGLQGAVTDCGASGRVFSIRVSGCSAVPCDLKVGETVTAEADFQPAQAHSGLNIEVRVEKGGASIPYVTDSASTPLDPSLSYTASLPIFVTGEFGTGPLTIKISASGDGVTEICGTTTANIRA